jgi:hypothetical protein
MADLCCTYAFNGILVNREIDGTHPAILLIDFDGGSISGLDGKPIRAQIDPKGQTDGGIVHTKRYGPRIIVFNGKIAVDDGLDPGSTIWREAVNDLQAATISALEAKLNTADTLSWTPQGSTAHSISCTYGNEGGEVQFGSNMLLPTFQFTLVAADPTITVA